MSDYQKVEYCPSCKKPTNHHYMDNVPVQHVYTIRCEVCQNDRTSEQVNQLAPDVLDLRSSTNNGYINLAEAKMRLMHTAANKDLHLFIDSVHDPKLCPECIEPGFTKNLIDNA